ncbi:hypothetical protein F8388_021128 [Cannabis sativa]|uniref:SET domain-containing protein n=1 Tax=Cannabis sativa TaxID=3483 RepID=A0A7J6EJQ9_CANSA|nr:hypothetical protein G4B88_019980 [Cannabis sativa]KAF4388298.1 hypothetical protein F8388_021128 [Cannabis sativa]
MAFVLRKIQQVVKSIGKNRKFAKDPRKLQYEVDMNRLFLYTSFNRLGKNAEEADVDEIIDMASKFSFPDQEKLVQETVHSQIKSFCEKMDKILVDIDKRNEPSESRQRSDVASGRSGLSLAIGRNTSSINHPDVPKTKPLRRAEVSQKIRDLLGYTLEIKPSQIPHKEAGQGLFLNGEADVGNVVAIYPGVVYSPAYYRYIPGYPRVDAKNPYLITRYDGNVINAQPWGLGDETCEVWNALTIPKISANVQSDEKGSDRLWKLLSKPLEGKRVDYGGDVVDRRNPLAFAHYANHPAKGVAPNVMICPYDFPLTEKDMRVYIPNVVFGSSEDTTNMKRFGSFWFKYGSSINTGSDVPFLRTLVLVATRALSNEEVLLNYRLSNLKRRPEWYTPVDEEEDRRRWS